MNASVCLRPECPVEAILSDTEDGMKSGLKSIEISEIWPNINEKKDPPVMQKNGKTLKINIINFLVKNLGDK